jgi:Raf kinase inhibitor-like YbhB/YbcL family protein
MTTAIGTLLVSSTAFAQGQPIPREYTADGRDISPPLSWSEAPAGTKEWALIVDDPDAPRAEPWVHWVIYGIPAKFQALPQDMPKTERVVVPVGCIQGVNSWGRIGYSGPEPPRGHGVHHYHFKLYALDADLGLSPKLDKKKLLAAMKGHVLAEGELVGTYERK